MKDGVCLQEIVVVSFDPQRHHEDVVRLYEMVLGSFDPQHYYTCHDGHNLSICNSHFLLSNYG